MASGNFSHLFLATHIHFNIQCIIVLISSAHLLSNLFFFCIYKFLQQLLHNLVFLDKHMQLVSPFLGPQFSHYKNF